MLDRAVVHDNRDPSKRGRLRVRIPTQSGSEITDWVWPVVPSGFLVLPKAGEQVWVTYESGDKDFPVWIGKVATTTSYKNSAGRDLKNASLLLERLRTLEEKVKVLEDKVADLEDEVTNLWAQKASVSHSHG